MRKSVKGQEIWNDMRENDKMQGKKKNPNGNRQILITTYIFTVLFLLMLGNLVYFLVFQSETVINSSYNKRQTLLAESVIRGKILGNDGEVLAETVQDGKGNDTRNYPYGRIFTHVVGHFSQGRTGIELMNNYKLLESHNNPIQNLMLQISGEKVIGDDVYTTLDVELQETAYDALGNHKGAVVAMNPKTGEILAMVSKPDYDPNPSALDASWNDLVNNGSGESNLVNRATQGLYPPGSTFKIVTTLEYLRENPKSYEKYQYQCDGKADFDNVFIHCYGNTVHGNIDLKTSFAKSCNSSFASIGEELNVKKYAKTTEELLFNQKLPCDIEYNKSSFVLNEKSGLEEKLHTAMGQGKTQITPYHSCLIVSAIANDGILMKPFLVDKIESSEGNLVKKTKQKEYTQLTSKKEARILTKYMEAVVEEGTAASLKGLGYSVAGKTGSAEYDSTKSSHAWFWGFAPADDPEIAIAVIVESSGTGSEYAVPIAKQLFTTYLN